MKTANYDNELNPPDTGPDYLQCLECREWVFVDDMIEQVCNKCRKETDMSELKEGSIMVFSVGDYRPPKKSEYYLDDDVEGQPVCIAKKNFGISAPILTRHEFADVEEVLQWAAKQQNKHSDATELTKQLLEALEDVRLYNQEFQLILSNRGGAKRGWRR